MPIYKSNGEGEESLEIGIFFLKKTKIFQYIQTLNNPNFLYEITQKLTDKE